MKIIITEQSPDGLNIRFEVEKVVDTWAEVRLILKQIELFEAATNKV